MKLRIVVAVLALSMVVPSVPVVRDLYMDHVRADQLRELEQGVQELKKQDFNWRRRQVNFVLRLDSYASERLLKEFPDIDSIMVCVADSLQIDYLLSPSMAVTEGGTRSQLMYRKLHNLHGQEERTPGALKQFASLKDGEISAGKLVIRLIGREEVNIDKLASKWCPVNKVYWKKTMLYCYLKAREWEADSTSAELKLKKVRKSSKV